MEKSEQQHRVFISLDCGFQTPFPTKVIRHHAKIARTGSEEGNVWELEEKARKLPKIDKVTSKGNKSQFKRIFIGCKWYNVSIKKKKILH